MLINAGKSYISDGINLESLLILQKSEMINKDGGCGQNSGLL